ncbi:MAG: dienelactone hydrolase family protein [Polyangiaceae bacterium]
MTTPVTVETSQGQSTTAALATPSGESRCGAVIVVHEWWGLNDDIRRLCDEFARAGFLALGIDLYDGKSTADASEAMQLATEMKTADAMKVVAGAVAYLASHPRHNGKTGITGFCLGGGIAIAGACTVPGLACAVPFYGLPVPAFQVFDERTPPILGHYAENDGYVTPERVRSLHEKAVAAKARFEVQFYAANHAFMREADPQAYHQPSAELAWSRTLAFLRRELGA